MKLFFSKGSCALAAHIVLAELNMVYEIESVDLKTKTCASGDFRMINPKGAVPALRMENGGILTEAAVIVQYLADQKPEGGLMPKFGSLERYRCQEWLNYIATDLHKGFSPLFFAGNLIKNPEGLSEFKNSILGMLKTKLGYVSEKLGTNDYLMGKQFTVADAYLFTVLSWSNYVGLDLTTLSNLTSYAKRVQERPGVVRAMKEQGLL